MKKDAIALLSFFTCLCLLVFASWGGGDGENKNRSEEDNDIPNYLCFTANNSCSISLGLGDGVIIDDPNHNFRPPILEYSFDGKKWNTFIACTTWISLQKGDKVYIRGDNNTISFSDEWYSFKINDSCKVSGNIMSLLDKSLRL